MTIGNQHTRKIFFDGHSKECIKCGEIKQLKDFHRDTNKYGSAYYCKVCATENSKKHHNRRIKEDATYKDSKRNAWLKQAHGITLDEYRQKLNAQDNKCSICQISLLDNGTYTHLDHDHQTGNLRDFLCTNCNRGLGHFQDSSDLLLKASEYLYKHRKKEF